MEIKNEIEPVWCIENNELKRSNKIVSKVNYKGLIIPVLKTELSNYNQEFLIQDKNKDYWVMNLIGIDFNKFVKARFDITATEEREYCDKFVEFMSKFDFKDYFSKKINREKYFNLCELEYVSKHFPELYENAKKCRETILDRNRKTAEEEKKKIQEKEIETVKTVNEKFEKRLEEIKTYIRVGRTVESEKLEFYKDNKYENGKTSQNCFLYLANQYGIKIPIATQGFINNRLVSYNFQTGDFFYYANKNNKPSVKMHEYLRQIYKKVNEDFDNSVKDLKQKLEKFRGGK